MRKRTYVLQLQRNLNLQDQGLHLTAILPDRDFRFSRANHRDLIDQNGLHLALFASLQFLVAGLLYDFMGLRRRHLKASRQCVDSTLNCCMILYQHLSIYAQKFGADAQKSMGEDGFGSRRIIQTMWHRR